MARTVKLDSLGLREKRHWPHLTADQQQTIYDFLGYYRAVAEEAYGKAAELAAIASQDLGAAGNAAWWGYTIRTIDWLLSRVGTRQRYLEIQLAIVEKRWRGQAPGPAT